MSLQTMGHVTLERYATSSTPPKATARCSPMGAVEAMEITLGAMTTVWHTALEVSSVQHLYLNMLEKLLHV